MDDDFDPANQFKVADGPKPFRDILGISRNMAARTPALDKLMLENLEDEVVKDQLIDTMAETSGEARVTFEPPHYSLRKKYNVLKIYYFKLLMCF